MKIKKLSILASVLMIVFTLCGCKGKGSDSGSGSGYVAGSTLCKDESILSMLKNDNEAECVLDGVYYSLPFSVGELTGKGWSLNYDMYEDQEVILQPGEYVDATLERDRQWFSVVLANEGEEPLDAKEANVVEISIYSEGDDFDKDFFVTKHGINLATSARDAKTILHDKEGFNENNDYYYITFSGDKGFTDVLFFSNDGKRTFTGVSSAADFAFAPYKPQEEKDQILDGRIAKYKENAEKNSVSDYDKIVSMIEANDIVPFYSVGTVVEKGTGNYIGEEDNPITGRDLSLYLIQDASGQYYCIYEGYVDAGMGLPELEVGDVISVWGHASMYTVIDEGIKLPTVIVKIMERNGENIYTSEYLD